MHCSTCIYFCGTRKSCNEHPTAFHCCLNHIPTPTLSSSRLVRLRLSGLQAKAYSPYITTSWDKEPRLTLFLPMLQTSDKPGMYKKREREQQSQSPLLPPPPNTTSKDSPSILQDVHNHYCRGNKGRCQLRSVIKQSLKLKPCT